MKIRIPGAAAAMLVTLAPAALAQVHEATVLRTVPDVGFENGAYTTCGVRVVFSDSQSADTADLYDLTVAISVKKDTNPIRGFVRATELKSNPLKGPSPQHGDRIPPADVTFAIASLRDPIHVHDSIVRDGTFLAPVDESKARQGGDFSGPLLRTLANGEPVLVIWSVSPNDQRTFRVKATPDQDAFDALQSCTQGTLQLAR